MKVGRGIVKPLPNPSAPFDLYSIVQASGSTTTTTFSTKIPIVFAAMNGLTYMHYGTTSPILGFLNACKMIHSNLNLPERVERSALLLKSTQVAPRSYFEF